MITCASGGGIRLYQVDQLGSVAEFGGQLAIRIQPLLVSGNFFEDSLRGLVVSPEPLDGRLLFKLGYFPLEPVEVKDTSQVCRGVREAQEFYFVFQLSAQSFVLT